jgi:hypothetical protein
MGLKCSIKNGDPEWKREKGDHAPVPPSRKRNCELITERL